MVAIARAVSFRTQLVVMDEPTSSLDDREVELLFGVIRQLKADGVATLFITHRLDELYAVCDRITVLRDGETVFTGEMGGLGRLELVAQMLGKGVQEVARGGQTAFEARSGGSSKTLLTAQGLENKPKVRQVDVSVRSGEIVGLAGLLGAGRTETARLVFGADTPQAGTLTFEGQTAQFSAPADAIAAGIGFCSEDRKAEGIVPQLSVKENLTLALLPQLFDEQLVGRGSCERSCCISSIPARPGGKRLHSPASRENDERGRQGAWTSPYGFRPSWVSAPIGSMRAR